MRILLGCLLLITGCCFFQDRNLAEAITNVAPAKEVEPTDQSSEIVVATFGFAEADMKTPKAIPLDTLPDPGIYHINVRVIIEGQSIRMEKENEPIEAMWWSKELKDVRRDLDNAEKVYGDIGIKFHVSQVSFVESTPHVLNHFIEANLHPHVMTIVYMLPNGFMWDGYSSAPWETVNRGIIINYLADEWTLAHEIGHYFGLLHPFEEDYVDDTPEQTLRYCMGAEHSTANCHNIMNYCDHAPKKATAGQLLRFKRFLRAKRLGHYVREYTDIMLRGHKFPTPSGTNIILNIDVKNPSKIP